MRCNYQTSDHKNEDGNNVMFYYVDQNNQQKPSQKPLRSTPRKTKWHCHTLGTIILETGAFDAVIRNVVAPNGLKEVLIPTIRTQRTGKMI